jgi:hypothetical protein
MTRRVLLALFFVAASVSAHAAERAQKFDPRADRLLREMSDYLGSMKSFKVQSTSNDQVVLKSGEKIDQLATSEITVRRPNALRSSRIGAPEYLIYDGRTFTMACAPNGPYSTVTAPPQIDAAVDLLRSRFHLDAPGADLLFSNPYKVLTENATSGRYIDTEHIDGMKTHHLAFTGKDVDFQIWILDGPQPLPVRYTITSKKVVGQPQFSVYLTHWEPNAIVTPADFSFQPPAGAQRSNSFPVMCGEKGS